MTILVTGGGGFLGGEIVRQLSARGESIRIIARGQYPELEAQGIDCHRGDLVNYEAVRAAVEGCEAVFHVAAKPGVWGSYASYYGPNTLGTENIIKACLDAGVKRLIYTSTPSVVHGGHDIAGADESLPYPSAYSTAYPATKALAEQSVLAANSEEFKTVSLRPHLIWGPGDNHLVPRIVDRSARSFAVGGPPSPMVDSTFIEDGARAHILAADGWPVMGVRRQAYFISQGEPWKTDDLVNGILKACGRPACTRYISSRAAWWIGALLECIYIVLRRKTEPPMTRFVAQQLSTDHWYDISAAERDFGFVPEISIEKGLARLAEVQNDG